MKNLRIILLVVLCGCSKSITPLQVDIRESYGEHLNTFDSTYVPDGSFFEIQTLKFFFTEEEQQKILHLADSVNFWKLPDTLTSKINDSITVKITDCPCPCTTRIKTNQNDKTVIADCYIANENYRNRLRYLEYEILKIVHQKQIYKALKLKRFSH